MLIGLLLLPDVTPYEEGKEEEQDQQDQAVGKGSDVDLEDVEPV